MKDNTKDYREIFLDYLRIERKTAIDILIYLENKIDSVEGSIAKDRKLKKRQV